MKAKIDEKGVLTIEAETPLETFALSSWWAQYAKPLESKEIGNSSFSKYLIEASKILIQGPS